MSSNVLFYEKKNTFINNSLVCTPKFIIYCYTYFLYVYAQFNLIYLLKKSKNPLIVYLTGRIYVKNLKAGQLVVIHIYFQNKCGVPSSNATAILEQGGQDSHPINEIGIHVQTIKTIKLML